MRFLLLALLAVITASSGGAQVPLTLDTSFRATRFVNGDLYAVLPLDDGSILASGQGISIDNCCSNGFYSFFRFLFNGDIDESWTTNLGYGDILAFGEYYYLTIDGFPYRYSRTTGEIDFGFLPLTENDAHPGLWNGNGGDIYIQQDGKVLCTGDHHIAEQWGANAPGWYSLLRVDTNGILDSTYHYRKTDGVIWTLEPTTQGRFLVSGVYNMYEGQSAGRILRIWPDGSLDTTFYTDIIKGYAMCYEQLPNGRIIAGGQFVLPNEPDTMHLIRLMPDGSLDTTFNNHAEYVRLPQTSFGAFGLGIGDVQPLADGTMIVAGNFTHIEGQLRRGVALLDSTGHLLNTALNGEGALLTHSFNSTSMYSQILSIGLAQDGSVYLAGTFRGFDDGTLVDTTMTFIAKLHGLSVGMAEVQVPKHALQVWPNPSDGHVRLSWPGQEQFRIEVIDAKGGVVLHEQATHTPFDLDLPDLPSGLYNLLVTALEGKRTSAKWMIR